MRNLAWVHLIGNVGRDAEAHTARDGVDLASFSLAVTSRRGEEETTAWYRVSCWAGLARLATERVKKGVPVCVVGGLVARLYEGRDGATRMALDVTARDLILLDSPARDGAADEAAPARQPVVKRAEGGRIVPADEPTLDELPF